MSAKRVVVMAAAMLMWAGGALADGTPRPADATLAIANLKNGDVVANPVTVKFALTGMVVSPAGVADVPNSGHHHLLIDVDMAGEALTSPIPADEHHVHFGKGQTETTVTLAPGSHTLRLLLGDANHVPHAPPLMSAPVTIGVTQ